MPAVVSDFIPRIFSQIPATYELINHLLTFGLDIHWRNRAARLAAKYGGSHWADLCTGTGETAVYLSRLAPEDTEIYAVDFTHPMLREAKKKPEAGRIAFLMSDIKVLPFPDNSLDLITMSFATRNINLSRDILVQSFAEFHRVLKPGGLFVNLETSQPSCSTVRTFRDLYVKLSVKSLGGLLSGNNDAYTYLAHSIQRFYPPLELADIMLEAGFTEVSYIKLFFGVSAIHKGIKGQHRTKNNLQKCEKN
jgi:demethylmenaquinone methyltransferase/2-methoxy-6-polyprenyl-1,4-benzoquinol methylase